MTNEKKQAFTLRITSANSTELIEILYEMLLEYVLLGAVVLQRASCVALGGTATEVCERYAACDEESCAETARTQGEVSIFIVHEDILVE